MNFELTEQEAIRLISEGENSKVEFKRKFTTFEKIARELIAFANSKGGLIFFGVDDNGEIVGVKSEKETEALLLETAKNYCEPEIDLNVYVLEIDGKDIVIGEVMESNRKPHRIQDYQNNLNYRTAKVFIRMKSKSVQASREMIKLLHTSFDDKIETEFHLGKKEKALFDYLEKNEKINTREFCRLVNISERRAQRILVKLVRLGVLFLHQEENGSIYFSLNE
ncbi:MAG: helix-turn-helix domain-containing protein [Ignavibacteria bacterium]